MSRYLSFHQGELDVQAMANESAIALRNGQVVSSNILPGAIPFIAQQNMVVISSMDEAGLPWSSVLFGTPGFIHATDSSSLLLDASKMLINENDPLWKNISNNPQVGVLAIELSTRRRFRVNGRIQKVKGEPLADSQFEITVQQAYPNCPKFIQRRNLKIEQQAYSEVLPEPITGNQLTPAHIDIIKNSDSFFVSSASLIKDKNEHNVDASHRGGFPGFIKVLDNNRLLIPDYQGNSMFNTLGNIHVYPRAGIIIVDYENSRVLQLSGDAKILWDQEDDTNHSSGTKRFWELSVEKWQITKIPKGVEWNFQDYSPHNPREVKAKESESDSEIKSAIGANGNMALRISKVMKKSTRINQYQLRVQDGQYLPSFEAGAHLPIEVTLGNGEKVLRHYSILSSSQEKRFYEIAIQSEEQGRGGSKALHQQLALNSVINVLPPKSEFSLTTNNKHVVLITGGIGITPILSMLRELVDNNASFEIHYTAKNEAGLVFKKEVETLAGTSAHFYTSQGEQVKRLDLPKLIKGTDASSHVYMCGPLRMISQVRELAGERGLPDSHVHFESFGVASQPNDKAIKISLMKSNTVITVDPSQTILDALIEKNISVPFDCKRGECGMCATTVLAGEAEHRDVYLNKTEQIQQMCVCVSRAKGANLTLDL
ncbi:MAG: pyridoxamine 5'-phosphate oxidase family protein [Bermanella sp.]